MPTFFISYRREDTAGYASWLSESLRRQYGKDSVFIDVHIPGGSEFPQAIARAVCACDVVIALIGPGWLNATDDGRRRLDDAKDFLRLELVSALTSGRHIIPLLFDRTPLPSAAELPEALRPLILRQAAEMSGASWHTDLERLIGAIEQLPGPARRSRRRRSLRMGAAALLLPLASWGVARAWSSSPRAAASEARAPSREPTVTLNPLRTEPSTVSDSASAPQLTMAPAPASARHGSATLAAVASVVKAQASPAPRQGPVRLSLMMTNNLYSLDSVRALGIRLVSPIARCFEGSHSLAMQVIYDISLTAQGQVVRAQPRAERTPGVDECAAAAIQALSFGPTISRKSGQVTIGWTRSPGFDGFAD